jgi:tetratricopeptide (TPR) repeat protein
MASKKHIERIEAALGAGDIQRALKMCDARLRSRPSDSAIKLLQGRALLAAGEFQAVVDSLAALTVQSTASADAFLMHAFALIQMERTEAAFDLVKSGLTAHPAHGELLQYAGLLTDQLTQPVESEAYFRKLTALEPERGDAHLGLGNALQRQGRDDEALGSYKAAAAVDPGNPAPLVNVANLLGKQNDHPGAQAAYQGILKSFPERRDVSANLGASLVLSRDYEAAVAAFDAYLQAFPDDFEASLSRAKAMLKGGEAAESARALAGMMTRFPDNPKVCPELINACLSMGEPTAATSYLDAYLKRFPKSADAYSSVPILHAALHPGNYEDGVAALEAEIKAYDLTLPPHYVDTPAFFDAVCAAVYAHPSLMDAPPEHATRAGLHTGDLAKVPVAPAIADLISAIKGCVHDYAESDAGRGNRFFDGLDLATAGLNMWAVVMREGGYQEPHIHPTARISGVVYGKVPDSIQENVARGGNTRAGWIEFGRPHADFHQPESLPVTLIQPVLGRIVLFPSYLYHATVPLNGTEHRISLAFDIVG